MKNEMAKTRKVNDPYEIWIAGTWEWRVLKKWQADDNKPFARWFTAVKSPFVAPSYEMGDSYAKEIMANATKLTPEQMKEHLENNQWREF